MKRLVTLLLLSVISTSLPAAKAQMGGPPSPAPYPYSMPYPQYAPPVSPTGQRPLTPSSGPPLKANGAFVYQPAGCANGDCGNQQKSCLRKIKDWICFCPTAGDALPKLHFHPFVGPWVGTFYCTPGPGGSCGDCSAAQNGGGKPCNTCQPAGSCAGNCKAAPQPGGMMTGQPGEGIGYPTRGCQGGSAAPVVAAPEQFAPSYVELPEPVSTPRTMGSNLDVREYNPAPSASTGTVETPAIPSIPQSKVVTPTVPSAVPAPAVATLPAPRKRPAGDPEVVQVEFRAVGSKPYIQTAEATTEAVGAPVIVKPIKSPLDLFMRQ